MNDIVNTFQQILRKHKLIWPVPPAAQEYILSTRKAVLINVIKSAGTYSMFYSLAVSVNVLLRNIGILLPMKRVKLVLFVCMGLSFAAISGVGYLITQSIIRNDKGAEKVSVIYSEKEITKNNVQLFESSPAIKADEKINPVFSDMSKEIKIRIGVRSFKGEDKAAAEKVTNDIFTLLRYYAGDNSVVLMNERKDKNVNFVLFGSYRGDEKNKIITVKLVNVGTNLAGPIIYMNIKSDEEIDKKYAELAYTIISGFRNKNK